MPHPSRRKGFRFEAELVRDFQEAGHRAERAYASNGQSLCTDRGERCTDDVDVLVNGSLRIQAKRRKAIADYIKPPAGADVTALREDRGQTYVVVPLPMLIDLLTTNQPTDL